MEKSKTVRVVELHAKADSLEKAVKGLREGFNDMKISPDMEKILAKLESSITSILQKTKDGVIPRGDFAETEKELKKVKSAFDGLAVTMQELQKADQKKLLALVPEDTKAKLKAASDAYAAYTKVLGEVSRAEQLEAAALKKKAEAERMAEAARSSKDSFKDRVNTAEAEVAKYKDITEALQEQAEATEALAQAQRELEEARSGKGEKAIANRQARVESAKSRKAEADTKAEWLSPERVKAYTAAKQEQIDATQKYKAALREEERAEKAKLQATAQAESATAALRIAKEKSGEGTEKEVAALAALRQALSAINPEYKKLTLEGETAGKKLENLGKIINGLSEAQLQKLKVALDQAGVKFDGLEGALNDTRTALDNTKEKVKETDEALSQQQAFENRIKQFLGLSGAAQVLRRALRDALSTITELDATMTEMAVVTDLKVSDYWDQLPEYTNRANALGLAINDVYQADTLFYQQGLKTNEVVEISTETMKMARIAGLDTAEATNRMTAALRGFNMELNQASAQKVADVYSELAAITAADTEEISSAMTKTASIASNAGMEFETTAAFLSQIIETTRESAETAGTAMKTIIARFQELKKDPAEIGEVDGEIVDANKIEGALRSVGVALRDSSGQFRDLDDVFLELAEKWDGLDKNTQRYIATIAAGSRQQSRFLAMMSDYSRTQELVTAANTSAGASNDQFGKTLDSLESKVAKLKNAWHEFTMGIMNSDLVKIGVDIATKFLEILNKATSGLEGLGGSVIKIMSILGIFKMGMKIFQKFRAPLVKFFADVVTEARKGGEAAGKAFDEGSRKGATSNGPASQERTTKGTDQTSQSFKQKVVSKASSASGLNDFSNASNSYKKIKAYRNGQLVAHKESWKNALEKTKREKEEQLKNPYLDPKEKKKTQKEIAKLTNEIDGLNMTAEEAEKTQAEMWNSISQGTQKAGQLVSGVGIAFSAFGGILSSMGLEEFGDGLAKIGNILVMLGTGISAVGSALTLIPKVLSLIPPILAVISAHPIIAILVAVTAAIIGLVVGVTALMNKFSASAKLEKAKKAAEDAEEAANKAAEAYDNLNNSLDELQSKYDAMDDIIRGTEEWNKALQDSNKAVLDLIEKYPELASLVKNVDGRLELNTNSDEVQGVINKYEASAAQARGVSLSANRDVSERQQQVDYANLEAINKVASHRGWSAAGTSIGIGAAAGGAIGATTGAIAGTFAGPIGSLILGAATGVIGAAAGALVGAVGGAIAGPIAAASTKTDEELQEATENLAKSVENGMTGTDFQSIYDYLAEVEEVDEKEAEIMAEAFAEDIEALRKFGQSIIASDAAQEAYYSAMATNAQQMINLGNYNQDEIASMNSVVDSEKMKAMEETEKERLKQEAKGSDSDEFKEQKKDFAETMYGKGARVEGNKIVDEKGETLREFENEEAWINAIAAANATEDAAKAMEKVPTMINKASKAFGNVVGKGLTRSGSMTKGEFDEFKTSVGYNSETKELDSEKLDAFWEANKEDLEDIYGEGEEGYKAFLKEYKDIIKNQTEAWIDIDKKTGKLGFDIDANGKSVISDMSAEAANTWTNLLADVMPTGTTEGADAVNTALSNLIAGKSQEDVDAIMSQIGAIDIMDAGAWDNLAYTLEDMGLVVDSSDASLQAFIDEAKKATNAIEKVDFSNFNQQINQTIELLKKAEEGARKYSEEEYKSFIAANKGLKNEFIQIGDEYVYLGTAMEDLTDAIMKNTVAKLEEANFLLAAQVGMAGILEGRDGIDKSESVEDQRNWLIDTVSAFANEGYDIKNLGIAGLSLDTEFSELDDKTIKDMVQKVLAFKGQKDILEDQQAKQMRDANVATYTLNDTAFNARMGYAGGEWADEHRDALRVQAIDAGVGDVILQSYANASKQYEDMIKNYEGMTFEEAEKAMTDSDKAILDNFRLVSQNMVDMIQAVEENEEEKKELDALSPLAEKVASAIEKQRQSTIDKLSDVNDSINSANDLLVSKIQEQIDADRQERENQKMKDDLSSMYAQQAYLGMDTSGANALAMMDNEKAIEQAEQEYRDAMIDQAIQRLQDANEQAAQQRERQINLLQQQLDYEMSTGQIADQAAQIVRESIEQVAAGQDVSQTKLNEYMQISLDSLGGMEKTQAKTEWMDIIHQAIQSKKPEGTNTETKNVSGDQTNTGGDGNGKSTITDEEKEKLRQESQASILQNAKSQASKRFSGGSDSRTNASTMLQALEDDYVAALGAGATEAEKAKARQEFQAKIGKTGRGSEAEILSGSIDGVSLTGFNSWDRWETVTATFPDGEEVSFTFDLSGHEAGSGEKAKLNEIVGGSPKNKWMAMYDGVPYIYYNNAWRTIDNNPDSGTDTEYTAIKNKYHAYLNGMQKYKTGGIADFTGPAWLDGTPSKPEYVLNSAQTERFFSLVDVLENYKDKEGKSSGDNYFEIEINVEKLENDYDIEQVADKIRRMIYEDATYRNTNAINHIR